MSRCKRGYPNDTNNEFSVFAEWQAYHATT